MTDSLKVVVANGVLALTLQRPEKRNALNAAMVEALRRELDRADLDQAVRVVTIAGAGSDFCAGADLSELLASVNNDADTNVSQALALGEIFLRIRALPKPVVAVVEGRALAGGCGLATACDLVLAHPAAQFGYPEVHRGFVPAMVMAMLRRVTGEKRAFDLVATGRVLSAAEAADVGLVSRVLSAEGFAGEVAEVIASLTSASPTALALIKQQLYQLDGVGFGEAVRLGAQVNAVARSTPDFAAAVRAFLDRPG